MTTVLRSRSSPKYGKGSDLWFVLRMLMATDFQMAMSDMKAAMEGDDDLE